MGALTLPASGSVYLDTNSVVYSAELIEPYRALLQPVWDNANPQRYTIVTSELTLLEALVKPFKTQDPRLEAAFRAVLLGATDVQLIPITQQIVERAARLRAATTLKTPDAIHTATALVEGCTLFITNDPAFRGVHGLTVTVLQDLLTP